MEGRSPVKEFVRHSSPKSAFDAFVLGDYIGGEMGFVYEYAKMLLPKALDGGETKNITSLMEMKIDQFDNYSHSIPIALQDIISKITLSDIMDTFASSKPNEEEKRKECFEGFFSAYNKVTDHYLAIRNADEEENIEYPLYFISYARNNRIRANQVELQLLRQNRQTWRDETDIRAGQKLVSSLYQGIDQAHTFICLLSNTYINSQFCMDELENAVHRNIECGNPRIIALQIDNCKIPSLVSTRLWLDTRTKDKLALAMKKVIEDEITS